MLNLRSHHHSRTSSVSASESEWRSESIIFHNPTKLPVIFEGKEINLTLSELENEYEDSEFGPDEVIESECVVEVNVTAADVM